MFEVRATPEFEIWIGGLRDRAGKARILARVLRLQAEEHWGDAKPVGSGIVELRIDCGPGYRVYCRTYGRALVLLLAGGTKDSQRRDIRKAREIARKWHV